MSVSVMQCFEYTVTCDKCGKQEVYHTGDWDNGYHVHTKRTAVQASGYKPSKYRNGMLLCIDCQDEESGHIKRICKNCKYFHDRDYYYCCFGQKNAPRVEPDDSCKSWREKESSK